MIGSFKAWINSMLCIGIFVMFIKLVIPRNKLKKYIYSMISIITIITVISPVVNVLNNETIEESLNTVIKNISETEVSSNLEQINLNKYQDLNNQTVKAGFIQKLIEDIKAKLESKDISVEDIGITLDNEYGIEKIEIKVEEYSEICPNENSIITFIKNEYDIDSSKIRVRGG